MDCPYCGRHLARDNPGEICFMCGRMRYWYPSEFENHYNNHEGRMEECGDPDCRKTMGPQAVVISGA